MARTCPHCYAKINRQGFALTEIKCPSCGNLLIKDYNQLLVSLMREKEKEYNILRQAVRRRLMRRILVKKRKR